MIRTCRQQKLSQWDFSLFPVNAVKKIGGFLSHFVCNLHKTMLYFTMYEYIMNG